MSMLILLLYVTEHDVQMDDECRSFHMRSSLLTACFKWCILTLICAQYVFNAVHYYPRSLRLLFHAWRIPC